MAQRPRDAWLLFTVMATMGRAAASPAPLAADARLDGVRVGLCDELGGYIPSEDVQSALDDVVAAARDLGATIVKVQFPGADLIEPTFVTTQRAEALETHRRLDLFPQRAAEYGADVRARLEQAAEIGLADYLAAATDRARIDAAFAAMFGEADVLITPVSPVAPVQIGRATSTLRGAEVDFRKLVIPATSPQNLAGLPACTLRAGFDSEGMPIGVQITAPRGHDARVVAVADALYEATPAVQAARPTCPVERGGFSRVAGAMPPSERFGVET
jgi:aspartyl-tRNA(Asn)/glutamyl-tRNA(Gln) amidotransferase subunit A